MSSPRQPGPDGSAFDEFASDEAGSALEAQRAQLDRFGRVAAHDLRAPLRSIEAFTRLALETDDPTEAAEHLDRVLNATGRMRRLLDSLVDFADAADVPLDVSMTPLGEIVAAAIADLSVDLDESDAIIDVGPLPSIGCDPTQMRRVFTNVLSNSIRYTSAHAPRISIRGFDEPDRVRITVKDDGDGFPSDLAEEAFQPLRRLTSTAVGQGLGLAICRRIMDRHGGEIWAESAPGAGTTISLILPRTDPTAWHEIETSHTAGPIAVRIAGTDVLVTNVDGAWFAVEDRCSHADCSFSSDGEVEGSTLVCNCHGSEFDVRTGGVLAPPAADPIRSFRVRETDAGLEIEL